MLKLKLFIVFSSCFFTLFSQKKQLTPLKKTLISLENKFSVKFSFSENVIKNKATSLVVEEQQKLFFYLSEIEKKTGLIIKKINTRYYTIARKVKTEICGYVYDLVTKEPLLNVSVITNRNEGVTTNEKGFFKIKNLRLKDTLIVSYLGYKSISKALVSFETEKCGEIYLEESVNVLNEVIISSYLTTGIVKKTDGSIVLRPKKQGILPGLTDADVLLSTQQLPGIQSPVESASGIHIRGGTPDQNLILFDGIKLYNTSHFFGSISAFNPYVVENVTVYKNASNAKYGNHIAGVIDIKTMSEIPEEFSVGAGFNFTNVDANATIPLGKKLGVQFSFRHSISDILNTPTFDKLSQKVFQNTIISKGNSLAKEKPFIEDKNEFSFRDFTTKLLYKPNENNTISLQQISIKNNLNYILENDEELEVRFDLIDVKNDGFGITWNKKWSKTLRQETSGYYSKYALFYDGNKKINNVIYDFTVKKNQIEEVSFNTQFSKRVSENSSLNFGYQFTYSNLSFNLEQENKRTSNKAENSGENVNNQQTLLLEYVLSNAKKVNVNIGLRTSYMPLLSKTFFEPRIYARLRVAPSLWVNGSAELKQQYTSKIIEFFTSDFGLENELWALSDGKEIPLLKSKQFTMGVLFNKNNWLIDAEVYHKKIDGLTSLVTGFNNVKGETIFNGDATIVGADILIKKSWTPKLSSLISYTFGDNELAFSGFNSSKSFKGSFSISNAVYLAQQVSFGNWNFSVGWTIRSGLPFNELLSSRSEQEFTEERIGDVNKNSLPAYHRLDASATYDFFWDKKRKVKSRIGLSLINIYNRRNVLKRDYEKSLDTFKDGYDVVDTFSLGFTPNVVFRVQF